jgi:hypothetical protein
VSSAKKVASAPAQANAVFIFVVLSFQFTDLNLSQTNTTGKDTGSLQAMKVLRTV